MTTPRPLTPGRLIVAMSGLVVIGFPMIYILWEAVNHLLSGRVGAVRWPIVLPVLVLFIGYCIIVSRIVTRWERRPGDTG